MNWHAQSLHLIVTTTLAKGWHMNTNHISSQSQAWICLNSMPFQCPGLVTNWLAFDFNGFSLWFPRNPGVFPCKSHYILTSQEAPSMALLRSFIPVSPACRAFRGTPAKHRGKPQNPSLPTSLMAVAQKSKPSYKWSKKYKKIRYLSQKPKSPAYICLLQAGHPSTWVCQSKHVAGWSENDNAGNA